MKQTIRFKGLSLNKDEQSAQHGELALCGNVELHDGALRPYQVHGTLLAGGDGLTGELLYVHQTPSYTHFITKKSDGLYWAEESERYAKDSNNHDLYVGKVDNVDTDVYWDGEDWRKSHDADTGADTVVTIDDGTTPVRKKEGCWSTETQIVDNQTLDPTTIRSIKSIGNTLCILNSDGLFYILCKNGDNGWGYKYLGKQPPFLDLQFNLNFDSADNQSKNTDYTYYTNYSDPDEWKTGTEDLNEYGHFTIPEGSRTSVTENVMACFNKAIDETTENGQFYAPFLIRYCYRLYDGRSLIMHSAPVLLFPMLQRPAMVSLSEFVKGTNGVAMRFSAFLLRTVLQMRRLSERSVVRDLQEWSDIIKSVDIFISPQFTRVKTSGQIETYGNYNSDRGSASIQVGPYDFSAIDSFMDGEKAITNNCSDVEEYFHLTYSTIQPNQHNNWCFDIPEYEEKEFISRIRNWSVFFKLVSTPVEQLITDGDTDTSDDKFCVDLKDVDIDSSVLKNITVQEQMTDDYKTHNLLKPNSENVGGLYVYNHRLNVYGIGETLFEGFSPETMFPYALSGGDSETQCSEVDVYVSTDSGLRKRKKEAPSGELWTIPSWYVSNGYCFYPDSRAVAMAIETAQTPYRVWQLRELVASTSLNGALSFLPDSSSISIDLDGSIDEAFVQMQNKIYTSKADVPFYFPNLVGESGINSVGTGEIIGIAAVTRPLVQGEVGKQNLVVFATDGIWVCEVSSTGTYSSMRNLSREVCVNKESICQMDQSILFATNRSLSRFVESDVVSVSEVLDGPIFDVKTKMQAFYNYLRDNSTIKALAEFSTPPLDFFRQGRELYDYTGSRVLVFPKDLAAGGVALMYSIRDGAWSTMIFPRLKTVINSYPSPYIQRNDGVVFCMDKAYDYYAKTPAYFTPGVIVTRTLTFSDTMDVLRGFRQYCDSQIKPLMFFYGSNDQRTWVYIGRSNREFSNYMPGHPYRFFRVAMVLQMYPSEEYQQLELEIVNKYAKL